MDEWLSKNGNGYSHSQIVGDDIDANNGGEGAHKAKRSRTETNKDNGGRNNTNNRGKGKRVPCPIDPSHFIYESAIAKHILVCPAAKAKQEIVSKEYYAEGINLGGHGEMGITTSSDTDTTEEKSAMDLEEAKELAYAILRAFHYIFLSNTKNNDVEGTKKYNYNVPPSNEQLQNISEKDIYGALAEVDLSSVEEGAADYNTKECVDVDEKRNDGKDTQSSVGRLTRAISKHRIKAGGPRHLRQIASILGHVRQKGLIASKEQQSEAKGSPLIVEMGAGRGMTGLVVAGATAASVNNVSSSNSFSTRVKLCLVERAGTRAKAETKIRTADGKKSDSEKDCLRLDLVDVTRVKCDLAHVDMSKALPSEMRTNSSQTIVIAKHLCGAGTDLALKSLRKMGNIDGCVMATCCHGLCDWKEYVGRDSLLHLLCSENIGGLKSFGEREFNLMKRWTPASVLGDPKKPGAGPSSVEEKAIVEEHNVGNVDNKEEAGRRGPNNIFTVVEDAGFECGGRGLGRACQRLIDHGRCEYLRNDKLLCQECSPQNYGDFGVGMLHYVARDITPQNALIVASKNK